ncbi:Uncharacterised protein [Salmonella enterica subsp. enterica serovar Bovismorbificans]|uniref:Uncharacterized protein n=2 Tax=Salmonella enterica subsp. enterica serovar Bovismorbificans TaxID=58097 RepID=A0A655ECI8_SALET|nr:Uncharacterised protein [Salmonella enterica subsp. enterica serovar Bovismorbificans]
MVDNASSNSSTLKMVINKMPIPSHKAYATPRAIFFTAKERNIYDSVIITSIKIKPALPLPTLAHFIESVPVISVAIARANKIQ